MVIAPTVVCMTTTYSDIVDAMVEAEGEDVEKLVLTEASMDVFLSDDNFTKETEMRQKETIGTDWSLPVETGDRDQLILESGETVELQ